MKHSFKILLLIILIQTGTRAQDSKPAEIIYFNNLTGNFVQRP